MAQYYIYNPVHLCQIKFGKERKTTPNDLNWCIIIWNNTNNYLLHYQNSYNDPHFTPTHQNSCKNK